MTDTPYLEALVDLADRAGAKAFEIGYLNDNVPVDQAGWWASVEYQGAKLHVEDHESPEHACLALAIRLLAGGKCRCRHPVVVPGERVKPGRRVCRWTLTDEAELGSPRWTPGCDVESIHVDAKRGDLAAIRNAFGVGGGRR